MPEVRSLEISNFRGIRELTWRPRPGVNCLIGHGDAGKTTILEAIDLALSPARRQQGFSDADFHRLQVNEGLSIQVVIGNLTAPFMDLEAFGVFFCGYRPETGELEEPDESDGLETVLVRRLEVGADLEPRWRLWSPRAPDSETDLPWRLREFLAPARLGTYTSSDLSFGARSVLGRMAGREFAGAEALAGAARAAREESGKKLNEALKGIISTVQTRADEMHVPARGIQTLIDAHAATVSQAGVALHDADQVPLRGLGTGSSRLLVAALQMANAQGRLCLVDEVEHALEPYRIVRLLHALGAKEGGGSAQVFLTTHSPVVLRELRSNQLFVVRANAAAAEAEGPSHRVEQLEGEDNQAAVRSCAEAFLAPSVIVCEGKTEVGFLRGLSRYWESRGEHGIGSLGVCPADGGGSDMFRRTKVFAHFGYRVGLFLDGDKSDQNGDVEECRAAGATIHRWREGRSTEQEIFETAPPHLFPALLAIAADAHGRDSMADKLRSVNADLRLEDCFHRPDCSMAASLGSAAKSGGWLKDIDTAERVAFEVVAPNLERFEQPMREMIGRLHAWCNEAAPARREAMEVAPAVAVEG